MMEKIVTLQDVEYARTCQATFTLLQTSKFIEVRGKKDVS